MSVCIFKISIFVVLINCVVNTLDQYSDEENKLITEFPKAKSVLLENEAYSISQAVVKTFPNDVLVYVTPWNNKGYDIAKMYGAKFTLLSPVWLQLKPQSKKKWKMEGMHDIDTNWLQDVRNANPNINIVPRIIFEHVDPSSMESLLKGEATKAIGKSLVQLAQKYKFDGFVIELWSQIAPTERRLAKPKQDLVIALSKMLHQNNLKLIFVISPPIYYYSKTGQLFKGLFQREDFEALAPYVDLFSLMTYDYSSSSDKPGPNSPIYWLQDCVQELSPEAGEFRKKILLGFNMYGYDFGPMEPSAVIGHQYLELLKQHQPRFQWDSSSEEHWFEIKSGSGVRTVYYPTLFSIKQRLLLAEKLGIGVSLWEIGQGLNYFYDLF